MSEKRRGLGRGLGALIPSADPAGRSGADRPVDVFFRDQDAATSIPTAFGTVVPVEDAPTPATSTPADETPGEPIVDDTASATVEKAAEPSYVAGRHQPSDEVVNAEVEALLRSMDEHDARESESRTDEVVEETPMVEAPVEELVVEEAVVDEPVAQAPVAEEPSGPELVAVPGATFAELPVLSIAPNPRQPRQVFDEEELAELVHSIREIGVLQPVVVRPAVAVDGELRYELIMGERRWRASREAGLDRIPAIIRETADDDLLRDALLENLHRSQLNPLEEAAAYAQLLEDFGCTHEDLASRIGRSRPQISNTIRLLKLPPLVQRRLAAGVLSAGHARSLLALDGPESMERLAQRIVSEGLSVRAVEEIVALGDATTKPRANRPRAGVHRSELDDLATRLGDRFDTRVSIALGRTKGKLSIEFASVEDLNRIVALLAPAERGAFKDAD